MKGYKYALHVDMVYDDDMGAYKFVGESTPVLVVLDIPDEALKSTPTLRYSDYLNSIKNEYVAYYRYANTDLVSLLAKFTTLVEEFNLKRMFVVFKTIYGQLGHHKKTEYISVKQNLEDIDNFVHVTKCRCSEAKVIDIIGMLDGKHYSDAISTFNTSFIYKPNATVKPDDWGHDLRRICGHGIHYFEYPILALLYRLQQDREDALDFMEGLNDDFKNAYLTEELNNIER